MFARIICVALCGGRPKNEVSTPAIVTVTTPASAGALTTDNLAVPLTVCSVAHTGALSMEKRKGLLPPTTTSSSAAINPSP